MSLYFNRKILFILLVLTGTSIAVSSVFALEVGWPTSPLGTNVTDNTDVAGMVQYFYEWGIAIGVLATFFALVLGGIEYLTSAGNPNKMASAKDRIFTALSGLTLLLSSFLILKTINPDFTTLKVPEGLQDVSSAFEALQPESPNLTRECEKARLFKEKGCGGEETEERIENFCGNPCSYIGTEGMVTILVNQPYSLSDPQHFKPGSADNYKEVNCGTGETIADGGLCKIYFYSDENCSVPLLEEEVPFPLPQPNIESTLGDDFANLKCIMVKK